jgi:hypothetical protein
MFHSTRPPRIEILDDAIVQILRNKTVTERVATVFDANRTLRCILESHLRWRYPDWSDKQIMGEIARRFSLGSD